MITVVILCVCLSVTALSARVLISTACPSMVASYILPDTSNRVFNSWILLKVFC